MNIKILIAEDHDASRELMVKLLQKKNYEVMEAFDGLDALEQFKEEMPDIIITDIQMPRMNGLDLVKNVREISSSIPIIAVTAFNENDYKELLSQLGVNVMLNKPINIMELLSEISKLSNNESE